MILGIVILAGCIIFFKNINEISGSTADDQSENPVGNSAGNMTGYSDKEIITPSAVSHTSLTGADDDLVYCIASVSKMYSTAAVMQLVDAGKVKLDGYVTEYLPDFKMADERYKDITVRMLMNHTSGIMGTTQ